MNSASPLPREWILHLAIEKICPLIWRIFKLKGAILKKSGSTEESSVQKNHLQKGYEFISQDKMIEAIKFFLHESKKTMNKKQEVEIIPRSREEVFYWQYCKNFFPKSKGKCQNE